MWKGWEGDWVTYVFQIKKLIIAPAMRSVWIKGAIWWAKPGRDYLQVGSVVFVDSNV